MPNYQESSIYKLCCKDTTIEDIYIGSTTNFRRRKNEHKMRCNNSKSKSYTSYKYEFIRNNGGWDNWDMIQVKEVSCNNKKELNSIERDFIDKLKPTMNCHLFLNKTNEDKKWREYRNEYMYKRRKEKILCECGTAISKDIKKRHEKSKKHLSNIKPN